MWQEWCREQSQEWLKRRCWGNWLRKCIWASAWQRWGSWAWRCLESFPEAGTTKARLWRGKMGDMFQQSKGWLQKVTVLMSKKPDSFWRNEVFILRQEKWLKGFEQAKETWCNWRICKTTLIGVLKAAFWVQRQTFEVLTKNHMLGSS